MFKLFYLDFICTVNSVESVRNDICCGDFDLFIYILAQGKGLFFCAVISSLECRDTFHFSILD